MADKMIDLHKFALLQRLDNNLQAGMSATAVIEAWCGTSISAERRTVSSVPDATQLKTVPVVYRRVYLIAGAVTVVDADNWYRPDCLTGEMNRVLAETAAPFGRVVGALNARREILHVRRLWDGAGAMPAHVLEHRALLFTAQGEAFSEVRELYRGELLTMFELPLSP